MQFLCYNKYFACQPLILCTVPHTHTAFKTQLPKALGFDNLRFSHINMSVKDVGEVNSYISCEIETYAFEVNSPAVLLFQETDC